MQPRSGKRRLILQKKKENETVTNAWTCSTHTHYRKKPVLTVQRLFTCIRTLLRLLWPSVETRDAESQLAFFLWRVFQKTTWRIYRRAVFFSFFALLSRRWKQSSSISSDMCVCVILYMCVSAKNHRGFVHSWLPQSPEVASTGTQTPFDILDSEEKGADTLAHTWIS